MPRELFTFRSATGRPRSPWTLAGSFVAHVAAIAVAIVIPLVTAAGGPPVVSRLDAYVVPRPPDLPAPPPATTPETTARNAPVRDAAPAEAADRIAPETPRPPAGRGTPGAIDVIDTSLSGVPAGSNQAPTLAAPPPARVEPVRPGGNLRAPERLLSRPPVYPEAARAARVDGTVILEATIDATGRVRDVRVLRSIPLLDRAAVEAVSGWRYAPTLLNGIAVPVLLTVTVTFTLR